LKLLMFYAPEFWFKTYRKVLPEAEDTEADELVHDAVVIFFHAEPSDEERMNKVVTKFVKNAKWLARKWGITNVILHSFTHLGEEKAEPERAKALLDRTQERLKSTGYRTLQTPYGYFLDLDIIAPGHPLARVYKEF